MALWYEEIVNKIDDFSIREVSKRDEILRIASIRIDRIIICFNSPTERNPVGKQEILYTKS